MAIKKAEKKPSTTALVPWDEKFAQYATAGKAQVQGIGSGGLGITFGRGVIMVGDREIKSGKINVVVVGYCALNRFYERDWEPSSKTPPTCYAFALKPDDPAMAPHALVAKKQSATCAECPQNAFGTAKVGNGKACANTIRLGMLTEDSIKDAGAIPTAELGVGHVSPTNLRRWKSYVESLGELTERGRPSPRPTWAVVTEITSENDPKTQIKVSFRLVDTIKDDAVLKALEKRYLKVQDALQQPYSAASDKPDAKGPLTKAGKTQKFAGKAGKR